MALENFTTYTESDPNGRYTVTSPKVDISGLTNNEVAYVISDKGADHFNAIDIDFETFVNSSSTGNFSTLGVAVTNTANSDVSGFATTDIFIRSTRTGSGSGNMGIYLIRGNFEAQDQIVTLSYDTTYYLTLERVADNDDVVLKIYSNSGRTTLVDTLTVGGFGTGTKWQYVYGAVSRNTGQADRIITGFTQNMDLNEAGVGGFMTTNTSYWGA